MDILTLKDSLCNVNSCNSGSAILEERDNNASLKRITICDIPNGALIVKMDNHVRFSNFIRDQKAWGFNKHSDYLIITNDKIVFIEMKSKKDINQDLIDDCEQKFTSDNCTMHYADSIFREMLSKQSFFDKREPHYVLLYQNPSITKTLTALVKLMPNTTPKAFRRIPISNEGTISFFRTI